MNAHIVLRAAEVMPEPIGGYEAFDRYLQENIRYPLEALENKIEGYVFVRFVVREDGYLVEPEITKGLGYGCDEEVLRVIKNAPPWKPGREGTQIFPVEMTIAVVFRLPR
ncbi:protein TonB [Thermonema lapsum]|uniref:Protein TonB n=1 Tax=Thermonema lapsum TaxID=28195 RepID=A0A846MT54_9BACT|nr:energy transducer TonB [Thermonema lapsum]NIK74824.1 protein TonB [Thermonema lapsum]